MDYEDYFKKTIYQQEWYESKLHNTVEEGVSIFNQNNFPEKREDLIISYFVYAKLNAPDDKSMNDLGNRARNYREVTMFYLSLLENGNEKAKNLIRILKTNYDINHD